MNRLISAAVVLAALLLVVACTAPGASGGVQHLSSEPSGAASGRPHGTVTGKVVDASGQPAAGIGIDWDMLSPPFTSTSEGLATVGDGTFTLALPPGLYRIQAGFGDSAPATTANVMAGETVTIQFQLPDG